MEKDGIMTIQLTNVWFRSPNADAPDWDGGNMGDAKGITYLKLSPGKHTVRVKFPFEFESTEKPVKAISNSVEIEVEATSSATATPVGAH